MRRCEETNNFSSILVYKWMSKIALNKKKC